MKITEVRIAAARVYVPTAFISGTFDDMVEWRDMARTILSDAGIHPVDLSRAARRHELTESYINLDLDRTHLLVGVYGARYGSLMNNSPQPPSWSHHEYSRHLRRVSLSQHDKDRPETLILYPKMGSPADELIRVAADRVYASSNLSRQQSYVDQQRQSLFLSVTRGEIHDFPDDDGVSPAADANGAAPQSRVTAVFSDAAEFDRAINAFLQQVGTWRLLVETAGDATYDFSTSTPLVPAGPSPTAALLEKIAPPERPAGLCLMVPKLGDFNADVLAEAVASANPWSVGTWEHLHEAAHHSALDLLVEIGRVQFAAKGNDIEGICQGIARDVAGCADADMYRVVNLARGVAKDFLTEVWPVLERHLTTERTKSGNAAAGLLLILSSNDPPSKFENLCQLPAAATSFSKPILLDAASMILPPNPRLFPPSAGSPRQ